MNPNEILSAQFEHWFRRSKDLNERAVHVLAGGATHDSWGFSPYPIAFERADGARKWDVDGHPFVDYWMGHGALLCGHLFPPVVEAVERQMLLGTHFGGVHELQIQWAECIQRLVPSAERVRFTSSGTESMMLAVRVARAYTGRNVIVRFDGHFHGWHDESLASFAFGSDSGINPALRESVGLANADDIESVEEWLNTGDVAAVVLEPGGGSSGTLAFDTMLLRNLRELTRKHGTLLVFDEVISGFRYAPGGVQGLCGVLPDITALGKIVSGGLPGGVVCGVAAVMNCLGAGAEVQGRRVRIPHTGTFNGNPLSAAAGVAMLSSISDGRAQTMAADNATMLVSRLNDIADYLGVDAHFFNQSSIFHVMIAPRREGCPTSACSKNFMLYHLHQKHYDTLRRHLLLEGVDCHPTHGWVSTCHVGAAMEHTVSAYRTALAALAQREPDLVRHNSACHV